MYTLLYSQWILNKDLLYSTWNSTQCYVPAWMGGGFWGRMDTCVCMAEFLHCSPENITNSQGYTPYKIKSLKFEENYTPIKII